MLFVEFPKVLYGAEGLPIVVTQASEAAALPVTFLGVPTNVAALQALSPAIVASVVVPLPTLSAPILAPIAANQPKKKGKD